MFQVIETVGRWVGTRGIWAMDRGGDRNKIVDEFLDSSKPMRFVIRLTKKRDLVHWRRKKNCSDLPRSLPCDFEATLITYEQGREKGLRQEPMMLLTSCKIRLKVKQSIWRIVETYLTRWKCDESFRYIKQSYNLEDLRVRSYTAIRNLVVLVLAVSYFAAVYLGQNLKLKILVERIFLVSKRFFGVPSFFNYAIADGLYNLLFPDKRGLNLKIDKTRDFQLCFSFWRKPGETKLRKLHEEFLLTSLNVCIIRIDVLIVYDHFLSDLLLLTDGFHEFLCVVSGPRDVGEGCLVMIARWAQKGLVYRNGRANRLLEEVSADETKSACREKIQWRVKLEGFHR